MSDSEGYGGGGGPARAAPGRVVVTALLGALVLSAVAFAVLAQTPPRYRAETQVALLPSPRVAPERIADYWEALSRGQAGRIAAEVLAQRRWQGPAAQAAGVPASSLEITAGVVADTSLINVGVVAGSPQAAEAAAAAVVQEATPVVEQVSGPFTLQVVQAADGSGKYVGAPAYQVYAVAAGAGLLIGGGLGMAWGRRRGARGEVHDPVEDPVRDPAADTASAPLPEPARDRAHGRGPDDAVPGDPLTRPVAPVKPVSPAPRVPVKATNGHPVPADDGAAPRRDTPGPTRVGLPPAGLRPGPPAPRPQPSAPAPAPRPDRSGAPVHHPPNGVPATNGSTNGYSGPRPRPW